MQTSGSSTGTPDSVGPGSSPEAPAGTAPVHRFWKESDNTHFFTMKESEKDKVIDQYAHIYTYEGIAFYAYEHPDMQ